MHLLLVLQAKLAGVSRPSLETPATFYLVCVVSAIVEMISKAVGIEPTAAAFRHDDFVYGRAARAYGKLYVYLRSKIAMLWTLTRETPCKLEITLASKGLDRLRPKVRDIWRTQGRNDL